MKSFVLVGRYPSGLESITNLVEARLMGPAGIMMLQKNYLVVSQHMQQSVESHNVCIPPLSANDGLAHALPDTAINGLIYVLPERGDHLLLFKLDIKQGATSPIAPRKGRSINQGQ
jgi:hypothetical protein